MASASGVLKDGVVVVADPKHAARLFERGGYGQRGEHGLTIDLMEAAHLLEVERLEVQDPSGKALDLSTILAMGGRATPRFESRFGVLRELRSRGYVVRDGPAGELEVWARGTSPPKGRPRMTALARSESDPFHPDDLGKRISGAAAIDRDLLLGVCDEEGDVTYYEPGHGVLTGEVDDPAPEYASSSKARLIRDRAVLGHGPELVSAGYGNEVGGLTLLSPVELIHLVRNGLEVEGAGGGGTLERAMSRAQERDPGAAGAAQAYTWLREQGLVPRTGLKFGVHFRVYRGLPGGSHAPFLVHALGEHEVWTHRELARFVRLAHSVRKIGVLWGGDSAYVVKWTRP